MNCPECGAYLHGVIRLEPVPIAVAPELMLGQLVSVVSTTIPGAVFRSVPVSKEGEEQ